MRSQRVLILDDRAEIGALEVLRAVPARSTLRGAGRVESCRSHINPEAGAPDLIVLDPQIKGLDGLRLLEQIRVIDPTIPVIVVTGKQASTPPSC